MAAVRAMAWVVLTVAAVTGAPAQSPSLPARSVDPVWSRIVPLRELSIEQDASGDVANGQRLKEAIDTLRPGDRLRVGGGTWSLEKKLTVDLMGTKDSPIWIEAHPGDKVVITRVDAKQNLMDVGSQKLTRFLAIRGFEFTGGSAGVRLHRCQDVWFDGNEVHHTEEAALTANSQNTARLHITRNHLHHTGGYGEGMYLGANNGAWITHGSVIALNHVHDTGGKQGDGIELKQGSYGNWIVGNTVHDTNYPAILVYGTAGKAPNRIERNICWGSKTNVMQVQGEALVRNNLLLGGGIGFHTHDHQGETRDLVFVHNTIVTQGLGADLATWGGRTGMVFANNAVYTLAGPAIRCENGSAGVRFEGNVVLGAVEGADAAGFAEGRGLHDFRGMDWNALLRDARPSEGSPLVDAGAAAHAVWEDLHGRERGSLVDVGCVERDER
jgi:hypothetical protein